MLIFFKVKNYASFKEENILDLRKTSYREHKQHVFEDCGIELLKTIAIYGKNASGKSNLIKAMNDFHKFVFHQLFHEENEERIFDGSIFSLNIEPFLLVENIDPVVEFEIAFCIKDSTFLYKVSLQEKIIKSEELICNGDEVYSRKDDELVFGRKFKKSLNKYNKYRKDRLYLSTLDYFVVEEDIKEVIRLFKLFIVSEFNVFINVELDFSIKGYTGDIRASERYEDLSFNKKVSDAINAIDADIVGIEAKNIEQSEKITKNDKEMKILKTVHNIYNETGDPIDRILFDLSLESSGTVRYLAIIEQVIELMENGGVFIIDELSKNLHPELSKAIVDLFQSSVNKKNAQLIFTTHEISLMNNQQFRRDEIVFVDKDNNGQSTIYPLSDLDVRQDASFSKDYIRGKYGAIPIIDTIVKD